MSDISPLNIKIPSENVEPKESSAHTRESFEDYPRTSNDYRMSIRKNADERELLAAKIIERAWCSYRDRQMFRLLKHAVCAAEHSLSFEILRKIAPLEAQLLRDPCINLKLKFRFTGEEFPPIIVFKIYTQVSDGTFSKYINGKKSIKPATMAARQACNQMGNRLFYEQLINDGLQMQNGKVSEESDVITLKDYMQYSSLLDELPPNLGGKANSWRRLSLEDISRYTLFYDVLHYAATRKMSPSLQDEIPYLMLKPSTQAIQLKHIEILTKATFPNGVNPSIAHLKNSNFNKNDPQSSARRTQKAINKVAKMKKIYQQQQQQQQNFARSETLTTEADTYHNGDSTESEKIIEGLNDEFENQVNDLYLWSQNLSINDDYLKSPRM